jgi:uncharacterized protein (DUF885 family)
MHEYFREYIEIYPSTASFLGDRRFDGKLENYLSRKTSDQWKHLLNKYLRLSRPLITEYDIMSKSFRWFLAMEKRQYENITWMLPLSSYENDVISLIFFNREFYPLKTELDVKHLRLRYKSMTQIIYTSLQSMIEGVVEGVVLPKLICKILVDDLEAFYKNNSWVIEIPFSIDPLLQQKYEGTLKRYKFALGRLISYLKETYFPLCRDTLGIGHLPKGKRTYVNIVKRETTYNIMPDDIFKYGIVEVHRLMGEFKALAKQLGYGSLAFKAFTKKMMEDPKYYAKDSKVLLDTFQRQRSRIRRTITRKYFKDQVKRTYNIAAVPKELEGSAAGAFYYSGNYTKHGNGKVFINTRAMKENPIYSTYVLSIHEGEPGHHYQFQSMIEKKLMKEQIFAFNSNGFVEGWALYTESLGNYTPPEYFGKLCYEMMRAVRLVVDVGIHYYGWSWDHAFNYMVQHLPMTRSEIKTELLRYICLPGQAVSYKVGEKVFKDLRDKYLGAQLGNIKDFHAEVLKYGIIPLEVLEEHINTLCKNKKNES